LYYRNEIAVSATCNDAHLWLPGHKHILSTHSELFRTVFASANFVEGREGVYEIDSQHLKPDILNDVVRWIYLQSIDGNMEEKVAGCLNRMYLLENHIPILFLLFEKRRSIGFAPKLISSEFRSEFRLKLISTFDEVLGCKYRK
jgi:hypothetical protein